MPAMTCPTDAEVSARLAALRPRGDAWRHGDVDALYGSVMGQFFDALGAGYGPTERRFCALVDEYFCSTAVETRDLWAAEYGVPDGCDPFADICEKVNATGDTTTSYAIAAAARRGWVITIAEEFITNVEDCTFGFGQFGTEIFGASTGVKWIVTVDRAASSAWSLPASVAPLFGLTLLGDGFDCDADIEPLKCLIRRIAPAHADLEFLAIN